MPKAPPKAQPNKRRRTKRQHTAKDAEQSRKYQTRKWRRLSVAFRQANPLCVKCSERGIVKPSQQVDHVIRAEERPDLFYDWDNLQALCMSCHARKTNQERQTGGY